MEPLVSIIIPVYNSASYVVDAVSSALRQTYPNVEVVVVDDGSTDNSLSLVKQIDDSRLRVVSQINQGACVARNRGIEEAKGEYIKFLDADDVMYPDAIAAQMSQQACLNENEVVFGDFDCIDGEGKVFYENHFDETTYLAAKQDYWFLTNWEMLITCPLHRRDYLVKYGGFDIRLRGGQESFLHLKLSLKGITFVHRSQRIFSYRSHQDEGRISCQRMNTLPRLNDLVYRNEAMLQMLQEKYGNDKNVFTSSISQRYFDAAWNYFCHGKSDEGRYCLRRSKSVPHLHYPKLKKSRMIARGYVFIGGIIGYVNAAKLMNGLIKVLGLGKGKENSDKLQKVLFN